MIDQMGDEGEGSSKVCQLISDWTPGWMGVLFTEMKNTGGT